jgi:hypothetical protein
LENEFFLCKEAGAKVKLKITRVIIMNLGIFGGNFRIFGQVGLLN